MAYDRRIAELLAGLAQASGTAPDDRAVGTLRTTIERYAPMRSSALDDLVGIIEDVEVGTTGVQDRWRRRVDAVRADLDRHFGDAVKDVMLPAPLQMFWDGTVRFERAFFERLGVVSTPQLVEDLLKHQGVLATTITDLETNWKDVLSVDAGLENDEIRTVQQIDGLVQGLINDIEAQHRQIEAEMATALIRTTREKADAARRKVEEMLGKKGAEVAQTALGAAIALIRDKLLGELNQYLNDLAARLETSLARLSLFSQAYRERAAEYRRLMSIEKGGVLTMFRNKRAQVAEYEKHNNLVIAHVWQNEAKTKLNQWADAAVGAQREDAAEFNVKVFDIIDTRWSVTASMDAEFRSRFTGIFTAPLTTDTIETLTESYMFRKAIDDVNARGAAARIDDARRQLPAVIQEGVVQAAQPLGEIDTDWPAELKEAATLSQQEFRTFAEARLRGQIDTALLYLGELRILLDPPRVQQEFSREELEALLR